MTTPALAGYLTQLKRGDAATPEIFTLIAEVGDIAGPDLKSNMEVVTSHSSGGMEESIPTTQSVGQVKFPVNFVPSNATHSNAAGLVKDWRLKTFRNFQMVWPDASMCTFSAYVSEVAFKSGTKPVLTADVTLDISGPIAWA